MTDRHELERPLTCVAFIWGSTYAAIMTRVPITDEECGPGCRHSVACEEASIAVRNYLEAITANSEEDGGDGEGESWKKGDE